MEKIDLIWKTKTDKRFEFKFIKVQGDQKKMPIFGEKIQPNLPKFAYNLIRGHRVRI